MHDHGRGGLAVAHNVRSRAEVDEVMAAIAAARDGVTAARVTTDRGGCSGHVTDPDGHPWEIAHNRSRKLGEDGSRALPVEGPRARWRRGRDSNPRWVAPYRISSAAP